MPRTIRFHLDENVDDAIAVGLRRRGVDVTTARGEGLAGCTDLEQIQYCKRTQRVIVTMDADFPGLHAVDSSHDGIAFAVQKRATIGSVIRGLMLIWEILEPDDMRGKIEFI